MKFSTLLLNLFLAILLCFCSISYAEAAWHCTIQADRTDELYNSLALSGQLGDSYPELNERFFGISRKWNMRFHIISLKT